MKLFMPTLIDTGKPVVLLCDDKVHCLGDDEFTCDDYDKGPPVFPGWWGYVISRVVVDSGPDGGLWSWHNYKHKVSNETHMTEWSCYDVEDQDWSQPREATLDEPGWYVCHSKRTKLYGPYSTEAALNAALNGAEQPGRVCVEEYGETYCSDD